MPSPLALAHPFQPTEDPSTIGGQPLEPKVTRCNSRLPKQHETGPAHARLGPGPVAGPGAGQRLALLAQRPADRHAQQDRRAGPGARGGAEETQGEEPGDEGARGQARGCTCLARQAHQVSVGTDAEEGDKGGRVLN
jgi:hypothetical protein